MGEPEPGRGGVAASTDEHALAARWSALHHGIDPTRSGLLYGYLRLMWRVARPFAVLSPTAITVAGVVLAGLAAWLAPMRTAGTAVALPALILSGLADSLDGAIAVVSGRSSRAGGIADAVADRLVDLLWVVVLWRCGAPWWLAATAYLLSLAQESLRWIWARQGRPSTVVTVAERPSRLLCVVAAVIAQLITGASWPPTICADVWVLLSVIAIGQLLVARWAADRPVTRGS